MLNKKPIFINAFARGGSNIIMNLLLTHSNVCVSAGETQKVFKGTKWDTFGKKMKKRLYADMLVRIFTRQDFFSGECYQNRNSVPNFIKRHIDRTLYYGRFAAMIDTHNRFKFENIEYQNEDLAKCRLLTKGLNGIVFTANLFDEMYSDATFLALIRNGLAICEGYVRRGIPAEKAGEVFKKVVNEMSSLNSQLSNYFIVRYEDMVNNPFKFMKMIYEMAKLDIDDVKKVRLQSKKVMGDNGKRNLLRGFDRQVFWCNPDELGNHVRNDVNENQIKQLKNSDKEKFLKIAGKEMETLGYLPGR